MADESVPPEAQAEVAQAVRVALAVHGYERLTTAKIADEYAKSESGLYYYYDSKDEMIAAFLDHAVGRFGEELAAADVADPEARLRAACERLFVGTTDEAAGVHVGVMELLSHAPHNETLREPLVAIQTAKLHVLTEVVRDGVEAGDFRQVDPEATAAFLLAAGDGSTASAIALDLPIDDALRSGWSAYVDSLLAENPN